MGALKIIDEREVLGKEFRIYGTYEDPLFLARDVANWIEYEGRSGQLLNTVDEDEKLTHTIYASGQNRNMWFLTEHGLYEVLMQSRKPIAKEFKKKVKEILKTIRQNGVYMTPEAIEKLVMSPDFLIGIGNALKEEQEKRKRAENIIQLQAPQVKLAERLFECSGSKSMSEVAKLYNEQMGKRKQLGRNTLLEMMRDSGIMMKNKREWNQPKQQYIDSGYFVLKTYPIDKGSHTELCSSTKVTPKGIDWLWQFLIKHEYIKIDE